MKRDKAHLLTKNTLKKIKGGTSIKRRQLTEESCGWMLYKRPYKTGNPENNLLSETPRTF